MEKNHPFSGLQVTGAALLVGLVIFFFCFSFLAAPGFVSDDYRYLHPLVIREGSFWKALWRAAVVENRWDDNWWVTQGAAVRFFRPLVILTYALDYKAYGLDPDGFTLSNIILHALSCALLFVFLLRIVKHFLPGILAALIFGVHSAHGENIWYVAGRTDTLGTIFFLLTCLIWLNERHADAYPWKTALLFFVSLLAKEYNAILPLFLILFDRIEGRVGAEWRRSAKLFLACSATFTAWYAVRMLAFLQFEGVVSLVSPYIHTPASPRFWPHVFIAGVQYIAGIFSGASIWSLMEDPGVYAQFVDPPSILLGLFAGLLMILTSLRTPSGRAFLAVLLIPLIMLVPLYVSARYLGIPLIGLAGIYAAAFSSFISKRRFAVLAFMLLVLGVRPAWELIQQLRHCPSMVTAPGQDRLLDALPKILGSSGKTEQVFMLDYPFGWLEQQFMQDMAEVHLGRKLPALTVLTVSQAGNYQPPTIVSDVTPHSFRIQRAKGAPLFRPFGNVLPQRRLEVDQLIDTERYAFLPLSMVNGEVTEAVISTPVDIRRTRFVRFFGRSVIREASVRPE